MSNKKDFWKEDRETLFDRAVENINDVSVYENYKEVLKIDKNSNALVMINEILKEV